MSGVTYLLVVHVLLRYTNLQLGHLDGRRGHQLDGRPGGAAEALHDLLVARGLG